MTNHAKSPVIELHSLIHYEERRIFNSFPLERRRGLIEIARSMDLFWTSLNLGIITASEQTREASQFITFGLNKSLHLFLDDSCGRPGFPLARSNNETNQWANSVLIHCGRLGLCEHLLEICRVGLGELYKERPRVYRFKYTSHPIGFESIEREDFTWMAEFIAHRQADKQKRLNEQQCKIWKIMSGLVDTWHKYYIQYETHPEVDEFYQEVGLLHAQRMFGQDSFPGDTKFGGEDFNLYRETVGVLIGWSLKHMSFCTQLMKKVPYINPRNIITVPQHFDDKVKYLASALTIDTQAARQALQTLTLTRENKQVHCVAPGNFVAPALIEAGQGRVIFPVWGCTSHPFIFMLNELKRKHRSDWDRAVDMREVLFRRELYELFQSTKFFKIDRNINIKIGGSIVTDIDALILDRSKGVVAIFQLKWQDMFGGSIRERESRKRNFQHTGNKWVERVSQWLASNSIAETCKMLGFEQDDINRANEFRIFVISRYAAHFSGSGTLDPRAAWGTWYQFLRIIVEQGNLENPLNSLFSSMVENSPIKRKRPIIPVEELNIRDVHIIVESTNSE